MDVALLVFAGLLLAAGAFGFAGVGGAPAAPSVGVAEPAPPLPVLTAEERARAVAVAAPQLQGLGSLRVAEVGPWTAADGSQPGAAVVLVAEQPLRLPLRAWPLADVGRTGAGPALSGDAGAAGG